MSGRVRLPGVVIVDYGVGNLASLKGALERAGYRVEIGRRPEDLLGSESIILPGVGAFDFAMAEMQRTGLDEAIRHIVGEGEKTVLGICLGMQLFFEHSEEGDAAGFGFMAGRVRGFEDRECHVGWNLTRSCGERGERVEAYYYNHSYYADCSPDVVRASAHFQKDFPVIVQQGRCFGVQFHPEKSQSIGQELLRSILKGPAYA